MQIKQLLPLVISNEVTSLSIMKQAYELDQTT
nr:MAG TPA: hypothetical protein [Caudoviricetes sp.]